MTKRIVSGVFLLIALGALGLILAGALTSGEQLIVRFLTAIIVAALGLYVISDLRLQSEDGDVAAQAVKKKAKQRSKTAVAPPPANSTAAFMATVTGKKTATTAELDGDAQSGQEGGLALGELVDAAQATDAGIGGLSLHEASRTTPTDSAILNSDAGLVDADAADITPAQGVDPVTVQAIDEHASERPTLVPVPPLEASEDEADDDSPYSDELEVAPLWPLTPDGKVVETEGDDETDNGGLTTIFSKRDAQPEDDSVEEDRSAMASVSTLFTAPEIASAKVIATAETQEPAENEATAETVAAAEQSMEPARPAEETNDRQSVEIVVVENNTIVATGSGFVSPEPVAPFTPPVPTLSAEDYSSAPLAEILDVRLQNLEGSTIEADIEDAIRAGEVDVISSLVDDGVLTNEGPLLDRDVRTMVYVAFTSNELRKLLAAGGMPDGDYSDIDLGEIEVFRNSAVSAVAAVSAVPAAELTAGDEDTSSDSDQEIDLNQIEHHTGFDALSITTTAHLSEPDLAEVEELDLRQAETASPAI